MADIYMHGWNFRGQPFLRAVRKAKEFGYDGMEAFAGHFSNPDDPVARSILLAMEPAVTGQPSGAEGEAWRRVLWF